MAFKFIVCMALVAVASAGLLPAASIYQSAPVLRAASPIAVAQPLLAKSDDQYDPNPQYSYAYDIQDALTGDSKSKSETRNGDIVQGEYSLNDADGFRRTVQYTADPINGFNAIVRRDPLVKAVAAAPVIKAAPLAYAAPIIKSAPLAYASPALVKTQAYASPALIRTQSFASPALIRTQAYASPALIRTQAYASPALIKTHAIAPAYY